MIHPDPIISCEIPMIQKIIQDETWLEGERRGCLVVSWDPVVQEHVCEVVLRIGMELRRRAMAQVAFDSRLSGSQVHGPRYDRAA
jgi:hypothetical protein